MPDAGSELFYRPHREKFVPCCRRIDLRGEGIGVFFLNHRLMVVDDASLIHDLEGLFQKEVSFLYVTHDNSVSSSCVLPTVRPVGGDAIFHTVERDVFLEIGEGYGVLLQCGDMCAAVVRHGKGEVSDACEHVDHAFMWRDGSRHPLSLLNVARREHDLFEIEGVADSILLVDRFRAVAGEMFVAGDAVLAGNTSLLQNRLCLRKGSQVDLSDLPFPVGEFLGKEDNEYVADQLVGSWESRQVFFTDGSPEFGAYPLKDSFFHTYTISL